MGKFKEERKKTSNFSCSSEEFEDMRRNQNNRCALTGHELTPLNLEVERKDPYRSKNPEALSNHYMVIRKLSFLTRHVEENEIINLAVDIIKFRGKEIGYTLKKVEKQSNNE
ncbi:hypothetical protein LEP1GSC050_2841 [Leptospira broomii serovar Hurstbridge str. 5399]|uniref:Uncharacterized protein n=1 Tax=Leptospira broomii serovar Hurstbridge str. 5399 TaxID=1049789 RepID=T0F7V4_9LEPT|nr:hypothetical protein [Leptospira broomii]EQA43986.1 hypothetical protein LEP1GSC050_2841 [Leptospira broomii serovar Hurstbridge str. 5399]